MIYILGPILFDPCGKPLKYALGNIDPRFGTSAEQVRAAAKNAEAIWENDAKRNLFDFDSNSELKINLVFDERQERFLEGKTLGKQLESVQSLQKGISQEYDSATSRYEAKKAQYQQSLSEYERRLKVYNQEVDHLNRQGGTASAEEYDRLNQEAKALNQMQGDIEGMRNDLNVLAGKINSLAGKDRQAVEAYNEHVSAYRDAYGEDKEFDQGVYTGDAINVYQFQDAPDLTLVLAHELGHALGLGHVDGESSLMYYMMEAQDAEYPRLSTQDEAALQMQCERGWPGAWRVLRDKLQVLSQNWLPGKSGV